MNAAFHCRLPTANCQLLGMGFITPWFFAAGAALMAIPIVIHLLNRRRFKVVPWAAMEFLLAAMRKNRRRLKFEQWLLLAVRCALLLLLGLALARPMACEKSSLAALAARRDGLHVIVIDNSYSMAYQADRGGESRTHLDQAKYVAQTMAEKLIRGGEAVAIVTAGRPASALIAKPTYNLDGCTSAIKSIDQSYGGTDLANALALATRIARDDNKHTSKSLYLLTDDTRSAFTTEPDALKAAATDAASAFGDANHVQLFNFGLADQSNAAVLDVKPTASLLTTKFGSDFTAVARGYGKVGERSLRWSIDKSDAGGSTVALSEATGPILSSYQAIAVGGPHVVTLSIGGNDRLKFDDSRTRVVNVASEVPVLVIDGDRAATGLSGASSFVEIALSPGASDIGQEETSKSRSELTAHVMGDQELNEHTPLSRYSAVILTNVGTISDTVATQLDRYVKHGGVVMIFMGPKVNIAEYNQVLLNKTRKLLPGELKERVTASAAVKDGFHYDFQPQGNLSNYLAEFKGNTNSGLNTASITGYVRLVITNPAAERVLDYAPSNADNNRAGDPAITVHAVGKGKVIFFSTTANADWTTLPGKPVYVPLIHELIDKSIQSNDAWLNLAVGDSIEVPPELNLNAVPYLGEKEKNDPLLNVGHTEEGLVRYRSHPLIKPGIYHLTTTAGEFPVAVNVPSDEADVRTLPEAAIRKALGDIGLTMHGDQPPAEESAAAVRQGRDLGWTVMLIVLAMACAECYMAMRFGHYKRTLATHSFSGGPEGRAA